MLVSDIEGARLRLGGRRAADLLKVKGELPAGTSATTQTVDVFDEASLDAFARGLTLLINCAGPSRAVGDRIALTALNAGADYLDPGGYDPLATALQPRNDEIRALGRRFIFNAGLFPGLSGVFPAFIVSSLDQISRLDCAYIGTDQWTTVSADDIIDSLGDFGAESGFSYIQDDHRVTVPFRSAFRRMPIEDDPDRTNVALMYTEEMARLARRAHIPNVRVWGGNSGLRSSAVLAAAKLGKLYRGTWRRRSAVSALVRASQADMKSRDPKFLIVCQGTGRQRDGTVVNVRGRMCVGDTYLATGRILGIAARLLATGRSIPVGAAMLPEAINPSHIMQILSEFGYTWTIDSASATEVRERSNVA